MRGSSAITSVSSKLSLVLTLVNFVLVLALFYSKQMDQHSKPAKILAKRNFGKGEITRLQERFLVENINTASRSQITPSSKHAFKGQRKVHSSKQG